MNPNVNLPKAGGVEGVKKREETAFAHSIRENSSTKSALFLLIGRLQLPSFWSRMIIPPPQTILQNYCYVVRSTEDKAAGMLL